MRTPHETGDKQKDRRNRVLFCSQLKKKKKKANDTSRIRFML